MKKVSELKYSIYSGLSGLQLPIPKYLFPSPYENASRLTFYASIFNSIEINSSFYKIPRSATLAKWAVSVPEHFKFTFKLWKGITHSKELNFNGEDVIAFFDSINAVNDKKGCVLIQFPPSIGKEYIFQLEALLTCMEDSDPAHHWKVAVEFRNKSWYHQEVFDLLNYYKAAIVIHDIPKSATPLINLKSNFMYIRFHGPTGNYRGNYSEDFLREYAGLLQGWLEDGKTLFVYFNNTMGEAFNNLTTLDHFIHQNMK